MLPESIRSLIREEQARQGGRFIDTDLEPYLTKLGLRAEVLADSVDGRCRGFVAYYCNDLATKQAFITLVLVDPRDRGTGLGQALVGGVLDIARRRGFTSCRLHVAPDNTAAQHTYRALGFSRVEDAGGKDLLEVIL